MKKWITALIALLLVLPCGVMAFAAESAGEQQVEIGVYAKCEYNVEGVHPAPIEDGNADVTTDDGTSVSVTDAPEGAVRLMVIPVPKTETGAWTWIEDCLKDTADPVHTFDIYFEDPNGNRIDADGAVVTIHCPHCTAVPVVCSLDTDGTVRVLTASNAGATVTFTTNGSPYYIMAEELPADNPDSPPTGDSSQPWLGWSLLIVSAMGITAICAEQKKTQPRR